MSNTTGVSNVLVTFHHKNRKVPSVQLFHVHSIIFNKCAWVPHKNSQAIKCGADDTSSVKWCAKYQKRIFRIEFSRKLEFIRCKNVSTVTGGAAARRESNVSLFYGYFAVNLKFKSNNNTEMITSS